MHVQSSRRDEQPTTFTRGDLVKRLPSCEFAGRSVRAESNSLQRVICVPPRKNRLCSPLPQLAGGEIVSGVCELGSWMIVQPGRIRCNQTFLHRVNQDNLADKRDWMHLVVTHLDCQRAL